MSKTNLLDVAPLQIPQVDNTLEEDSFHSPEQFEINISNKSNKLTETPTSEPVSSRKDQWQINLKMSSSQVIKQNKADSQQLINVQIRNESQQIMLKSILSANVEQDIKNYLYTCSKKVQTIYSQFKTRLATEITHKLKKQIQTGCVSINPTPANINYKSKENQLSPNDIYKQLQKKKDQAIKKIKDIQAEKINLIATIKKKNISKKQSKRDILTENEKQRLVELVKQKRQFQKSVNKKNQQLIEEAKIRKIKDQKQRQKIILEENEKKKIKILKSLKFLQLKSKQRQQLLKNSVLRDNRIYTHRKYQKQWKQRQRQQQKQQKDLLQSIHKRFELNIAQIKKHQKKYSLDLKKRQEQNKQKQSRISQSLSKRQKTYFDRIVQQEIIIIKQKNQQEKLKSKQNQFKRKILEYQQIIDKNYQPKIDTSNSLLPIKRNYSSVSLSKEQRVEIGLEYLAKAKQLKKSEQKREKIAQNKSLTGYSAYKDYMKERQPVKYNISIRQFSEIVKKPKQNYEELQIAKNMAEGLQAKFKKNADNKLYQSMKNKLLLLDSLY